MNDPLSDSLSTAFKGLPYDPPRDTSLDVDPPDDGAEVREKRIEELWEVVRKFNRGVLRTGDIDDEFVADIKLDLSDKDEAVLWLRKLADGLEKLL